jgi:Leucine-rich repeat (LRR) protein
MVNYVLTQNNINEMIPIGTTHLICKNVPYVPEIEYLFHLDNLDCTNNNLEYIPTLPDNLRNFNCAYNKLTYLPKLPSNLKRIDCSGNKLTSLPMFPEKLSEIQYGENNFNDEMNEILSKYNLTIFATNANAVVESFSTPCCSGQKKIRELCKELNEKGYIVSY